MTSRRVALEWQARVAAEYTSAAVTQHFVLWLMQVAAPPDLIDAGLVIVADELVHSRLSHAVYAAAGGTQPPVIDVAGLALERRSPRLEHDLLRIAVRVFCLGETVAVPLFRHLRERCTVPVARAALDRILRDEVRHREFGWDMLDWLMVSPIAAAVEPELVAALPGMFAELERDYGSVAGMTDETMTEDERAWGLAPAREYAEILARTFERDYLPRFAARGISLQR